MQASKLSTQVCRRQKLASPPTKRHPSPSQNKTKQNITNEATNKSTKQVTTLSEELKKKSMRAVVSHHSADVDLFLFGGAREGRNSFFNYIPQSYIKKTEKKKEKKVNKSNKTTTFNLLRSCF